MTADPLGRGDYGPVYASSLWESAEKLRRVMERCHDPMRRCTKLNGPTGKPRWFITVRGLWGKGSERTWQDLPCRACELERMEHDPGDEDRS